MAIKGFVEHVSASQVRGWAFDRSDEDAHVFIEVTSDAVLLGTTEANLFRADLLQANFGRGDHGFILNFPELLDRQSVASLEITARSSGTGRTVLNAIPARVHQDAPASAVASQNRIAGHPSRQRPLFILGAARSGTSALAQSLLKIGAYEGYEEGHFFNLCFDLVRRVSSYYEENGEETFRQTMLAHVPQEFVIESIKDVFRATTRLRFPGGTWLDKTPGPGMVRAAGLFSDIWPEARFVFMKRRAIENIASRCRKFPDTPFGFHCQDWTDTMRAWRDIRSTMGSAAIEIEQAEMASTPVIVSSQVAAFLDLSTDMAGRLESLLSLEQPERTAPKFSATVGLEETGWTSEQKEQLVSICGEEMKAYGYDYGK